jgi:hypothetical protein
MKIVPVINCDCYGCYEGRDGYDTIVGIPVRAAPEPALGTDRVRDGIAKYASLEGVGVDSLNMQ